MAWQRFLVTLKGEDPVIVETNARDKATIVLDPANPRPFELMYRMVHNAMRRQRYDNVPRDFEGFLEVLADDPQPLDAEDSEALDPTQSGP